MEVRAQLETAYSPPRAPSAKPVEYLRAVDQLPALARDWQSLARLADTPMQHFIWSDACAGALPRPLVVVAARGPQGEAVALAPLQRHPTRVGPLGLLGQHELREPQDVLSADSAALDRLAAALVRLGQPLWFERLPAESPFIPALQRAFHKRGVFRVSPALPYPYIELSDAWQQPETQFNSGRRSDLRRMRRIAQQQGEVSHEIIAPTPEQLPALLDEAYRVEDACWKGAEGSALARDNVRGEFFRRYTLDAARNNILRLCFLRIAGKAAAMQIAIECGERFWLLKIGYDENFSRCSPGSLLMLETLRYSAQNHLRSYEFLGSPDPWTKQWTQTQRQCSAVRAYPLRPRALALLAGDTFSWLAQRARRKLRRA